ncbi:hypothetical protein CGRA01v4_04903 [Colletotrichum graminicola]|nr:hypothetical protein CGRA01v4_04903 [Colletotrichum graminicola]
MKRGRYDSGRPYSRSCMVFPTGASPNWKQLRSHLSYTKSSFALPTAPLYLFYLPQIMIPHLSQPSLPAALHTCLSLMPRRVCLTVHT